MPSAFRYRLISLLVAGVSLPAFAAGKLDVTVDGLNADGSLPVESAFCGPLVDGKETLGGNVSPGITWLAGPEGTKSYALIEVDHDVPADLTGMNTKEVTFPADGPRQDFYHWVLVNIPAETLELPRGIGKGLAPGPVGARRMRDYNGLPGVNDYPAFMKLEMTPETVQKYTGYDGSCPPWNDERVHQYHFKVYALDAELALNPGFTGKEAVAAIAPHILAEGEVVGSYTRNPALKK